VQAGRRFIFGIAAAGRDFLRRCCCWLAFFIVARALYYEIGTRRTRR